MATGTNTLISIVLTCSAVISMLNARDILLPYCSDPTYAKASARSRRFRPCGMTRPERSSPSEFFGVTIIPNGARIESSSSCDHTYILNSIPTMSNSVVLCILSYYVPTHLPFQPGISRPGTFKFGLFLPCGRFEIRYNPLVTSLHALF